MAYIAPAATYYEIECLADSQFMLATIYFSNESEIPNDDLADAIRAALEAYPLVDVVGSAKHDVIAGSF